MRNCFFDLRFMIMESELRSVSVTTPCDNEILRDQHERRVLTEIARSVADTRPRTRVCDAG